MCILYIGRPGIPPPKGIRPRRLFPLPPVNCFIIFWVSASWRIRRFTSSTLAPLAGRVQEGGLLPLGGGHGLDDGLGAAHLLLPLLGVLLGDFAPHAGNHLQNAGQGAHLLHLPHLLQKVVEVQLPLLYPLGGGGSAFLVHLGAGLFNQGHHIAKTQNTGGHALRVEGLQVADLLPHTGKLNGLAGGSLHRKGRAAAGVAVQLGEDNPVHPQAAVEALGHVNGVLAGHGVDDQKGLIGLYLGLDGPQLVHQRLVDVQAAGGVDNDNVVAVIVCVGKGLFADEQGVCLAHLEDRDPRFLSHHLQLVDGGGQATKRGRLPCWRNI